MLLLLKFLVLQRCLEVLDFYHELITFHDNLVSLDASATNKLELYFLIGRNGGRRDPYDIIILLIYVAAKKLPYFLECSLEISELVDGDFFPLVIKTNIYGNFRM